MGTPRVALLKFWIPVGCRKNTMCVRETSGFGGGEWANARGRPDVFTCFIYYLECIYVSVVNGRTH
jgi:hypothetical protein